MNISATFTPAEFEGRDVSCASVVVIDCLRASTSIVAALASGAKAVYPFLTVADAVAFAGERAGAVLAGERGAARIDGFDIGNSPGEFTPDAVGGRDVVMTTTNGTRLLALAEKASAVYVGCFTNAQATVQALSDCDSDVILAAAGTGGLFSIEDALCAGLMVALLDSQCRCIEDDAASFARLAYDRAKGGLRAAVDAGIGATNVRKAGLAADVDFCMDVDSSHTVAMALSDPLRIVKVERA